MTDPVSQSHRSTSTAHRPAGAAPRRSVVDRAAIEVRSVRKKFRVANDRRTNLKEELVRRGGRGRRGTEDFWALSTTSRSTIPRGSTYGLIGHNGSGKSTLLKLIAGIHRPTTGTVTAHGRVSALLELGAGFHPELSGRENIYLNGAILGLTPQADRPPRWTRSSSSAGSATSSTRR